MSSGISAPGGLVATRDMERLRADVTYARSLGSDVAITAKDLEGLLLTIGRLRARLDGKSAVIRELEATVQVKTDALKRERAYAQSLEKGIDDE